MALAYQGGRKGVDSDHVNVSGGVHLLQILGMVVRHASIVYQDADVEALESAGKATRSGGVKLAQVSSDCGHLHLVRGSQLSSEIVQLGLGARDNDQIESYTRGSCDPQIRSRARI